MENTYYPFSLKPLKYPYDALEPYIDAETVKIHHDKHLGKYVDNLNEALKNCECAHYFSLEKLITKNSMLPVSIQEDVLKNAGGVYNHNFYFDGMAPNSKKIPSGNLLKAINRCFGSYDRFKDQFKKAALSVFGSGYAVLCKDYQNALKIMTIKNQDTTLPFCLAPILIIDVWEHSYYLKYQNRRAEYIDNWFEVIDFDRAENLYNSF